MRPELTRTCHFRGGYMHPLSPQDVTPGLLLGLLLAVSMFQLSPSCLTPIKLTHSLSGAPRTLFSIIR